MEENEKRKVDFFASDGDLKGLLDCTLAKCPEAREYALGKLIEYYEKRGEYGHLLHYCLSSKFPESIRERAGMGVIGLADALGPGSKLAGDLLKGKITLPPGEGILREITLLRGLSEELRIAAGKKIVELLEKSAGWEPVRSKAGLTIIIREKRYLPDVREAALNALDSLGLKKKHARDSAVVGRAGAKEDRGKAPVGKKEINN